MGGIDLVTLDVDGVIRDSSRLVYDATRAALGEIGLAREFERSFTVDEMWHLKGLGRFNSRKAALPAVAFMLRRGTARKAIELMGNADAEDRIAGLCTDYGEFVSAAETERMVSAYTARFDSGSGAGLSPICPGVEKFVELTLDSGKKLGIVTNASRVSVERDIPRGMLGRFGCVVTRNDVKETKPSGEGLRLLSSRMRVEPRRSVYIGDTVVDVRAAKDAGFLSAVVLTGMGLKRHLEAESPDMIFDDLEAAAAYILH